MLRRVMRRLATVLYAGQDQDERMRLVRPFRYVRVMMDEIEQKIEGMEAP